MPGKLHSFRLPDETVDQLDEIVRVQPPGPSGLGATRTDALIESVDRMHAELAAPATKTVKLLVGIAIGPANPMAKLGPTTVRGRKCVVEITEVPTGKSLAEVCLTYSQTAHITRFAYEGTRYSLKWSELGRGKIIQ